MLLTVAPHSVEYQGYHIRPIKREMRKLLGGFYSLLLIASEYPGENAFLIK